MKDANWMRDVIRLLKEGWGVEDIVIRLECGKSDVREVVEILRETGAFDRWYKKTPQID